MAAKGLVLFHGAGGDKNHPLFLALAKELSIPVSRVDFPYRKKGPGRRPPDRMPKLMDAVDEAVAVAAKRWKGGAHEIVIGGRSMGGRAASMSIAEGLEVAGLLLLSYPLHPTGKPEKLRVDHFPQLDLPVLLVQGSKDSFGTPAEFAKHVPKIPGEVTELWLTGPGSGHDPKGHDPEIIAAIQGWLALI